MFREIVGSIRAVYRNDESLSRVEGLPLGISGHMSTGFEPVRRVSRRHTRVSPGSRVTADYVQFDIEWNALHYFFFFFDVCRLPVGTMLI